MMSIRMNMNWYQRYTGVRNRGINPQGFHVSQIKFYILLVPLAAVMLLPIIFIFSSAFKPPDELFAYPPRFLVVNPTFKNFTDLFSKLSTSGIPVSRYLFNSILITLVTVGASIIVSSAAAYSLSKKRFKLKQALFAINNVALMFVPVAVTIPRFLVIERLNLLLMSGSMSSHMKSTLRTYLLTIPANDENGSRRVWEALWMIMVSPEYVIEK